MLTHVEQNLAVEGAHQLDPALLARLVGLELDGKLTATQAKTVLAEMVETGQSPDEIAKAKGFEALDASVLEGTVDAVIGEHSSEWDDFVEAPDGDKKLKKLKGFFTGHIMQATKGQADGKMVNALLEQLRAAARKERGLE